MTQSALLIYALYGKVSTASLEDLERIIAADKAFQIVKPSHDGTLMIYFDEGTDAAKRISQAIFIFLQKLFNGDKLPAEIADYAEIRSENANEHMKKDNHTSFAWTLAVDGKLYGSQIYLV